MSTSYDQFLGVGDEGAYSTAVVPDRFFEFTKETVAGKYDRIEAAGIQAGAEAVREDRWAPNAKGATGDLTLEWLDKNFGFWLKHLFGAVAAGAPVSGVTPFTATLADLTGKSFTAQVARVDTSGTLNPFTYEGGKATSFQISNQVDGVLTLQVSCDFAKETPGAGAGAYALAVPTYPDGAKLLTFRGGTVTVAGTELFVNDVTVKVDNGLDIGRWGMRGVHKEPRHNALRKVTTDLKCEFDSLTHYNRVSSANAAGAVAELVLDWAGPDGTTGLTLTLPKFRFDTMPTNVDGLKTINVTLGGQMLKPADGSEALTALYKTTDATA